MHRPLCHPKSRFFKLAAERRQHKERAAEARKATAGGGAGALVARFQSTVAAFHLGDGGHLDAAARAIFTAADSSAAAARALSDARAPEALAAALATKPAATGQLGLACGAVSRRLPTVVAVQAVAENENAATSAHWLNACARALAVHSAEDGVCGSTMARAIASAARQNLDEPHLVLPSLHVLDRLYNGVGERRPSINCGRRASLLQLGMNGTGPARLRTTDDRLMFQIAAALDRLDDHDVHLLRRHGGLPSRARERHMKRGRAVDLRRDRRVDPFCRARSCAARGERHPFI